MAEISQEELNERLAILRRFRSLLEEQKKKFQDYLEVLEKQENSIENDNTDVLVAHAEIETEISRNIKSLQKVIVPISEMYSRNISGIREADRKSVEEIQENLDRLQEKVLKQNAKNRELLRTHIAQIRKQIDGFKNPYRNVSSVYAKKVAQGNFVAVEV